MRRSSKPADPNNLPFLGGYETQLPFQQPDPEDKRVLQRDSSIPVLPGIVPSQPRQHIDDRKPLTQRPSSAIPAGSGLTALRGQELPDRFKEQSAPQRRTANQNRSLHRGRQHGDIPAAQQPHNPIIPAPPPAAPAPDRAQRAQRGRSRLEILNQRIARNRATRMAVAPQQQQHFDLAEAVADLEAFIRPIAEAVAQENREFWQQQQPLSPVQPNPDGQILPTGQQRRRGSTTPSSAGARSFW